MQYWFTEYEANKSFSYSYLIEDIVYRGKSDFQTVDIVRTPLFGRMMVIDGCVMLVESDEFVYHELIAHIPVCMHQGEPGNVLVIGGGDGGTLRELTKYNCIDRVTLCEIDELVIEASKQHLPFVASGFDDDRVNVQICDGIRYLRDQPEDSFDLVIIDSTDPVGPGEVLFSSDFYQSAARVLKPNGLMVAQTESPWMDRNMLGTIKANIEAGFKYTYPYVAPVPSYPRGFWSWTLASQERLDIPTQCNWKRFHQVNSGLEYLNEKTMTAVFALPNFYLKKLGR